MSYAGSVIPQLSDALRQKAQEELKENLQCREQDIERLRELIKADKAVYCPHDDDSFLLMFLRARKFDCDSAAKLIRRYYEVRVEYKDFYTMFRPSAVKSAYEKGIYVKLPKLKDTDPQPIFLRLALWDPAVFPLDDVLRGNIIQIEKLIRMPENQVNGIALIFDMNGLTWTHAKNISPFVMKRTLGIVQHAMPCRMKAIHYVNVPHFFEYLFAMVKPFMSTKLQSRLQVHTSPDYLKEHFDVSILPEHLGGTLDIEPCIKEWAEAMCSSEDDFKSWEKYGIKGVEAVSADNNSADPSGGITGTFKKLNVD